MNVLLLQLVLFGYVGALLFFLAELASGNEGFRRAGTQFLFGSAIAHLLQAVLSFVSGTMPHVLSMSAWVLVVGYLALHKRYKLRGPGVFAATLAAVLYFTSFVTTRGGIGGGAPGAPAAGGIGQAEVWMAIHLVLVLSGMASFFLAFITALLYLTKENALKQRRTGGGWRRRLSPLETLDSVTTVCMQFGLVLLTFGIGSGVLLNQHTHETPWQWSAHEITSLVAWSILLAELLLRMTSGWRGRRTAVLNVFGFTVTMATLVAGFVGLP